VVRFASEREQRSKFLTIDGFESLTGRGVRGRVEKLDCVLGNHRLIHELGLCSTDLEASLEAIEEQGHTAVVLVCNQRPWAIFAIADQPKIHSRKALEQLKELDIHTLVLSGDNPHTVASIAEQLGVDDARGNLLPEQKLEAVQALKTQHGITGMVGDGINDAPAMAKADIGFAMGAAGTDTAIETADVALMDDNLEKLPWFIRLSRTASWRLKQNIALALGIKLVFIVLALMGEATLWMAVFADMGASLLVVFNGLRLLRFK
jgi:Cd2+/Zn2+-exporting ATPase